MGAPVLPQKSLIGASFMAPHEDGQAPTYHGGGESLTYRGPPCLGRRLWCHTSMHDGDPCMPHLPHVGSYGAWDGPHTGGAPNGRTLGPRPSACAMGLKKVERGE